jgi:hypothetical protein
VPIAVCEGADIRPRTRVEPAADWIEINACRRRGDHDGMTLFEAAGKRGI